jgi:FMN phosphatase YigB (HAD superfamily)
MVATNGKVTTIKRTSEFSHLDNLVNEIYSIEQDLRKAKIELTGLEDSLDLYKFEVEKAIASDDTLKNDNQRKAKRLELQNKPDYSQMIASIVKAKDKINHLEIELNLSNNRFSVAKLRSRHEIANLSKMGDF